MGVPSGKGCGENIDPVNDIGILIFLWLPFVMCTAYNKLSRIYAQLRPERTQQKILSVIKLRHPHKIRMYFSLMYFTWNISVIVRKNLTV